MPEAVASNSIPAPEGQPLFKGSFEIMTTFENCISNLEALNWLLAETVARSYLKDIAAGIGNLYRRETEDLRSVFDACREEFNRVRANKRLLEGMVDGVSDFGSAIDRLTGGAQ